MESLYLRVIGHAIAEIASFKIGEQELHWCVTEAAKCKYSIGAKDIDPLLCLLNVVLACSPGRVSSFLLPPCQSFACA